METFQNVLATFTVKRHFFSAVRDVSVCPQRAAGLPRVDPGSKRSQAVRFPKQPPPAVPKGVETRSAPRMRSTADSQACRAGNVSDLNLARPCVRVLVCGFDFENVLAVTPNLGGHKIRLFPQTSVKNKIK